MRLRAVAAAVTKHYVAATATQCTFEDFGVIELYLSALSATFSYNLVQRGCQLGKTLDKTLILTGETKKRPQIRDSRGNHSIGYYLNFAQIRGDSVSTMSCL